MPKEKPMELIEILPLLILVVLGDATKQEVAVSTGKSVDLIEVLLEEHLREIVYLFDEIRSNAEGLRNSMVFDLDCPLLYVGLLDELITLLPCFSSKC